MTIELLVAVIAGVVAIISAVVAYVAQTSASKMEAEMSLAQVAAQMAHERKKPFVEAQMKYYIEATEIAAKIPSMPDGVLRNEMIDRFWQLYRGALALVEDNEVAGAMIVYGVELEANPNNRSTLENLSLGVAHACRNSLKRLWVPEIGFIKADRPKSK